MLNPPIESDWKNDTIKKNEKCIFKTISATSKENPKSIITKKIFLNKILKQKTSEKIKGKKKFDLMDKNLFEQKIKRERKIKINDPFLYELISANKDCILLKRKKFREVKLFLYFFPLIFFPFSKIYSKRINLHLKWEKS